MSSRRRERSLSRTNGPAIPRAGTPGRPPECRADGGERLELGVEVSRGERDRSRGRQLEQLAQSRAVTARGAECHCLPREILRLIVDRCPIRHERAAAGAGDDESFLRQACDRALDRHRGGAVARHELPDGRQAAARGEGTGSRPHILDNTLVCVIANHG